MIRWSVIAMMVGLSVTVAQAEPAVDEALWQAAGVVRLPDAMPAPPLRLHDLSGELVDLAQLRGRLVMLYFWATW
jgi:hypothetical protein